MDSSENQDHHMIWVKSWLIAFGLLLTIFVVSVVAILGYPNTQNATQELLDGSFVLRVIAAFSGMLLFVLFVWAIEYMRERRQKK